MKLRVKLGVLFELTEIQIDRRYVILMFNFNVEWLGS